MGWPRLALAGALSIAVTGCGGSPEKRATATPPFPPRAAEPGRAPVPEEEPAGRAVKVGGRPEGVVFDAKTGLVAVAVSDPPRLVLLDRAGSVRRRVPLPGASRHLQLAGPGGPVLVPSEPADALVEVFLPDGRTRVTRVGDQPHDATAIGARRFVADEFSSTISVVENGRRVDEAIVDAQPGGIVAAGKRVAVISVLAYTVEVFDGRTLRRSGSRNAGLGPTHAVADGEHRLYITDTRGDAVIVYETVPRLKWVGRIELPGSPYGIALDERRGRLWVTLARRNEVVELTAEDQPRRLRTLPTVRQPNTVAVDRDTGRLFATSRTDGTLQLIDP